MSYMDATDGVPKDDLSYLVSGPRACRRWSRIAELRPVPGNAVAGYSVLAFTGYFLTTISFAVADQEIRSRCQTKGLACWKAPTGTRHSIPVIINLRDNRDKPSSIPIARGHIGN